MTFKRISAQPRTFFLLPLLLVLTLTACAGNQAAREQERNNRMSADALYDRAKKAMDNQNYRRAIDLYELLEVQFPFGEYTRQGQLDLMYAYYRSHQTESAVEAANRFIRENPRHEKVDYAYYVRGLAYFPESDDFLRRMFRVRPHLRPQDGAKKSFDAFASLVQKYPDSEWAEDATQRMIYLRNAMAGFELNVANYYIRRGAYVAAANRAKRIIEEYQETDAVLDALRVQIVAYNRLGFADLAKDSQRVLDQNLAQRQVKR